MEPPHPLGQKKIFLFWAPLAATWLMMAAEWPFVTAIVARLADPKENLAAWGITYAISVLLESPVIMLMSASNALARDRASFLALRRFSYGLSALMSLLMALLLFTPLYDAVAIRLIGLPPRVATLAHQGILLMLPWPVAIGYRRFYQGLLIRDGQTGRVAWGTVIRICAMAGAALLCYFSDAMPGASVAAVASSAGVLAEAVAARRMARRTVAGLLEAADQPPAAGAALTLPAITRFYAPLALMSVLGLAVHPMVVFFLGHSRFAIESLAVVPVVNGLVFLFRCLGLSYQELAIALLGDRGEHYPEIRRFGLSLAAASSLGLGAIVLTPLARIWFQEVAGLSPELAGFAIFPSRILVLLPAVTVIMSLQRAVLVEAKHTAPVTWSTAADLIAIVAALTWMIDIAGMTGATAAAIALLAGRLIDTVYLVPSTLRIVRTRYRTTSPT